MELTVESLFKYPFVLKPNEKARVCSRCPKSVAVLYCPHYQKFFCRVCSAGYKKHYGNHNLCFDLKKQNFSNIPVNHNNRHYRAQPQLRDKKLRYLCLCYPTIVLTQLCVTLGGDINQMMRRPLHKNNINRMRLSTYLTPKTLFIDTPFFYFYERRKSLSLIQYWVGKGAKIYFDGNTSLFHQYLRRNTIVTSQLIKFFKEKSFGKIDLNFQNLKGQTPFHLLCSNISNYKIAHFELFFELGANCNIKDMNGMTPFHSLCIGNKPRITTTEILSLFLKNNADLNSVSKENRTAFYYLCRHNLTYEQWIFCNYDEEKSILNHPNNKRNHTNNQNTVILKNNIIKKVEGNDNNEIENNTDIEIKINKKKIDEKQNDEINKELNLKKNIFHEEKNFKINNKVNTKDNNKDQNNKNNNNNNNNNHNDKNKNNNNNENNNSIHSDNDKNNDSNNNNNDNENNKKNDNNNNTTTNNNNKEKQEKNQQQEPNNKKFITRVKKQESKLTDNDQIQIEKENNFGGDREILEIEKENSDQELFEKDNEKNFNLEGTETQEINQNNERGFICNYLEIIKYCLDKKADLTAKDSFGYTAFHNLCISLKLNLDFIKYCFEKNYIQIEYFHQQTQVGNTPFHSICKNSPSFELIRFLIENKIKLDIYNKKKEIPFLNLYLGKELDMELIKFTVNSLDKRHFLKRLNKNKQKLFHFLIMKQVIDVPLFKSLIKQKKIHIKALDDSNNTILHYLCKNQNADQKLLQYFLKKYKRNFFMKKNKDAKTAFHILCFQSKNLTIDTLKLFLERGFKMNQTDKYKQSAFMLLCKNKSANTEILKYCINSLLRGKNAIPNAFDINRCDQESSTPLHHICQRSTHNEDLIKLFIENGATTTKINKLSTNPFQAYCRNAKHLSVNVLQLFVDNGILIGSKDNVNRRNLFYLFENSNLTIQSIQFFLNNNADINIKDTKKLTPLHRYLRRDGKNLGIVAFCLNNGADLEIKNQKSDLFYHVCICCHDYQIIKMCLEKTNIKKYKAYKSLFKNLFKKSKVMDFLKILSLFLERGIKLSSRVGDITLYQILYILFLDSHPSKLNIFERAYHLNFNTLKTDFKNFFNRKEFTDGEIKGIKIHSKIIEWGTKKKLDEVEKILEKYVKENIEKFLYYLYTGIIPKIHDLKPKKRKIIDPDFLEICSDFNINEENHLQYPLQKRLNSLYQDMDSKDFVIIVQHKYEIKVHKFVLQSRSGLYRNMFLSIEDPFINKINDYSGYSADTMQHLIKYLYTDRIDKSELTEKNIQELYEAQEYFQLDHKNALLWRLDYL
ncbi:ankyrin repeat [Anaeramoeba flamelloides]|uniref:Ankyrin repeat n=1 Tax=Anaeramoeba flamelloides TaxID=1746091 RepID=A0ABQ8Z3V1_9EUKA|nr:ankyrin repeat [Anaeramoeba flamelloides]